MKHLPKMIALMAIALLALAACNVFTYSAGDLKNKVLTYYFDDGHSTKVLTFDSTGKSGTFAYNSYTYYWSTSALYNSGAGLQATKTWYKDGGFGGTFTYDPDTSSGTMTQTSIWAPKSTAVSYGGYYAEADYETQTTDQYLTIQMGVTVTGSSITSTYNGKITADNMYEVYVAGTTDNTWVSSGVTTTSGTAAGTAFTSVETATDTFTIADGTMNRDNKTVTVSTSGSTSTTATEESIYDYTITHNFIVGQDDKTGETFADVWKKGNTVTFLVERNKYQYLDYTGTTAPTAPTVSTTTGTGSSGTSGVNYYYISTNMSTDDFELVHEDGYMLYANQTIIAGRHLGAK
jgi:hypothetical protein